MTWLEATLFCALACVLLLGARLRVRRAYLRVNPRYRPLLEQQGLNSPQALLSLPAIIVSGHPDRNVSKVTLGSGENAVRAFLKREHRVRWKQRLLNFFSGFGAVSLSHREGVMLGTLSRAGVGCPDWIAFGSDGRGRAFLLVKELAGGVDLRMFLGDEGLVARDRQRFARDLGAFLAQMHRAGFAHRDLYAKHILLAPLEHAFHIIDWQRAPRPHRLNVGERWRDLAALDATLADELAEPRERVWCFHAYCRAAGIDGAVRRQGIAAIRNRSRVLSQRRHIREARQVSDSAAVQELIWLDGEALCVTPQYFEECNGSAPVSDDVALGSDRITLVKRSSRRLLAWLATWFGAKPLVAPEVRQAGLLFRLQRYGVHTTRLLAFGQRASRPWRIDSFLLTEAPSGGCEIFKAFESSHLSQRQRYGLIRSTATEVRRLHAAGCYLPEGATIEDDFLMVHEPTADSSPEAAGTVTLARIDGVRLHRQSSRRLAARNLAALCRRAGQGRISRTDKLRFLLTYLGLRRLNSDGKQMFRLIESALRKEGRT